MDWSDVVNADLHVHSHHSKAVSRFMDFRHMAEGARLKGLDVVGTGDILNPLWERELLQTASRVDEGTYEVSGVRFILTAEVEDERRVHHLLIFPSLTQVHEMRERLRPHSANMDSEGRPHVSLPASEIAEVANDLDVLIGPAHAFTPWTSLYKEHSSMGEAYDGAKIDFLELGLSADSGMADRIKEHHRLPYLSNSDAHSPYPHRLGREFNRFTVREATFEEIRKALRNRGGRRIVFNAGLDPRLGKYYLTACSRCYRAYDLNAAVRLGWRCPACGGRIKMGVRDRVLQLADTDERPADRPPYIRLVPLAEVISRVTGRGVGTKTVERVYRSLVETVGNEIRVLVDAPVDEISRVDARIASVVERMRTGRLRIVPGGGGRYGRLVL
ncbi:MAG: TIGR00375 family protein [Thermococci archaeon]|nr:TIGR00375 family protein [Thermococci archaeon]